MLEKATISHSLLKAIATERKLEPLLIGFDCFFVKFVKQMQTAVVEQYAALMLHHDPLKPNFPTIALSHLKQHAHINQSWNLNNVSSLHIFLTVYISSFIVNSVFR